MKRVFLILGLILLFSWDVNSKKVAVGSGNKWKLYENGYGLYVDIDTSKAKFKKTPVYFTSLSGTGNHYVLTGIEAVYSATKKGFRVYVRIPNQRLTVDYAKQRKWTINWIGIEKSTKDIKLSRASKWLKYPSSSIYTYLKVKTKMKGYRVFTGLGGQTRHWTATGAPAIKTNKKGFNVYLRNNNALTEAKTYKWLVNIMKVRKKSKKYVTGVASNWKDYYNGHGLYIDVPTGKYKFKKTPKYFTSLTGKSGLADLTGITAIYNPSKNGFRVYITRIDGKKISVSMAKKYKWKLHWMAVGPRKKTKKRRDW
jgi:hypothetical protein